MKKRLLLSVVAAAALIAVPASSALAAGPNWNDPSFQAARTREIVQCWQKDFRSMSCVRVVWYGAQAVYQFFDPPPVS